MLQSLTHLCRADTTAATHGTVPFPLEGVSGWFVLLLCFKVIPLVIVNSIGPDQTPRSAASDLDLYCLPMSISCDARRKWVKENGYTFIRGNSV